MVCFSAVCLLFLTHHLSLITKVPLLSHFKIAKPLYDSSVSVGLFSKILISGGPRTSCSIPENHNLPVLYVKQSILLNYFFQHKCGGHLCFQTRSELVPSLGLFLKNLSDLLEIHCVHETQQYLRKIVHEIGLELKSCAVCTQVRRIRDGVFTLDDALLRTQWNLQSIRNAISDCQLKVREELEKTLGHQDKRVPKMAAEVAHEHHKQSLQHNNVAAC